MMLPRSTTLLFLPAAAAMMGCSANVASSAEIADAEASPVTAVIVVERSTRFDEHAESTRGEAVARFVRMRSGVVDEDALRMVGAALDIPAVGTCSRVASGSALGAGSVARAVELVDVGAVSLEAEGAKTTFNARRLPDVVDLVSGVVYTGRGEEPFPAHGRFLFRAGAAAAAPPSAAAGNGAAADLEIAPLAVESAVAGEPSDLRFNQELVAQSGAPVTIPLGGSAVEIAWAPPQAGAASDPSDVVYVDVTTSAARAGVTRCAFADSGHGVLASASIPADEGTFSVHRVHRESFHGRGIDSGELRFDFARVVSFHRR
jgi:hypothetical protein